MNPELTLKAIESMKSRFRFSYSIYDFAYNLLWPFKCFGDKWRKGLFNVHQRYKLYQKGEEKFIKEFDAVEFARTQRKLKMLMHSLMDESERFLAPYQKSNTIKLIDDSETDHSDDPSYLKIPKMKSDTNDKEQHRLIVNNFL